MRQKQAQEEWSLRLIKLSEEYQPGETEGVTVVLIQEKTNIITGRNFGSY